MIHDSFPTWLLGPCTHGKPPTFRILNMKQLKVSVNYVAHRVKGGSRDCSKSPTSFYYCEEEEDETATATMFCHKTPHLFHSTTYSPAGRQAHTGRPVRLHLSLHRLKCNSYFTTVLYRRRRHGGRNGELKRSFSPSASCTDSAICAHSSILYKNLFHF